MTARIIRLTVVAPGVPSWWTALAERTFTPLGVGSSLSYGTAYSSSLADWQKGPTLNEAYTGMAVKPYGGVTPFPQVISYGGGCIDQSRAEMLLHGGGHMAYYGNEVYAFNFRASTPGWAPVNATSTGSVSSQYVTAGQSGGGLVGYSEPIVNCDGQYAGDYSVNGAPMPGHTYHIPTFANGKMWLFGISAPAAYTKSTSASFAWDRAAGVWSRVNQFSGSNKFIADVDIATHYGDDFCALKSRCYLPDINEVWGNLGGKAPWTGKFLWRWSGASGALVSSYTLAQLPYAPAIQEKIVPIYSAADARWMCAVLIQLGDTMTTGAARVYVIDPLNVSTTYNPTLSNPLGVVPFPHRWGATFVKDLNGVSGQNVLFFGGGGEDIYYVKVPAAARTGTYTIQKLTLANAADGSRRKPDTVSGDVSSQGPYGRWNVIEDIGDDGSGRKAAIAFLCNTDGNSGVGDSPPVRPVWILKLPQVLA